MTTRSFHQPDPSDHRSLAPKRRRRFRISLPSGQRLTAEELDQVWAAYRADRSDLRLRNRLVEHYLPWAGNLAASIAGRMELRDRENAVGEVLAALVAFIVPDYSGHGSFQRWACICIKRKLIALKARSKSAKPSATSRPEEAGSRRSNSCPARRSDAAAT